MNINANPYIWKEKYNLEIEFLDQQHKKFLEIINLLKRKIAEQNYSKESISEIFYSLAYYAENYLVKEEIYLSKSQYPKFNSHRKDHNTFIDKIVKFQTDFRLDNKNICLNMYEFLESWFDNHILIKNKEFAEFLKQQNIK
ncbi:MAG: bacteriohemerythrin [Bacteroidales bacterium]|jgi:hemerythrin|nr:bacteriohemerythrin [Bacteroidales bacterium]